MDAAPGQAPAILEDAPEPQASRKFRPWYGTTHIHQVYQWGVLGQAEEKREELAQWIAEKFFDGLGPEDGIDICCFQLEKCPDTGRAHFQWFVRFKCPRTFRGVSALPSLKPDEQYSLYFKHAWTRQVAHSQQAQVVEYCRKEETRKSGPWYFPSQEAVEEFIKGRQGKRSDLSIVAEEIKEGKAVGEVAVAHPVSFIRYHRGIASLSNVLFRPDANRPVETFVIYGDPRTSKTYSVWETFQPSEIYQPVDQWFEHYDPQEHKVLLLDDVEFARPGGRSGWSLPDLLSCCQGRPQRLRVKGSSTWANWRYVVVSHNLCPEDWFPFHPADQQRALFARFKVVQERRRGPLGVACTYRVGNENLLPAGLRGPFNWQPPARGQLAIEPRPLGFGAPQLL